MYITLIKSSGILTTNHNVQVNQSEMDVKGILHLPKTGSITVTVDVKFSYNKVLNLTIL